MDWISCCSGVDWRSRSASSNSIVPPLACNVRNSVGAVTFEDDSSFFAFISLVDAFITTQSILQEALTDSLKMDQEYGPNGYNQNGYNQNGNYEDEYNQDGYGQNGYSQNGYSQNGYRQNGYHRSPPGYGGEPAMTGTSGQGGSDEWDF